MQYRRHILPHFTKGHFPLLTAFALSFCACNRLPSERPVEGIQVEARSAFAASLSASQVKIATNWLSTLRDPQLTRVVHQALANNPDLRATATQLRAAKEGTIIGRAARLPDFTTSANTSRTRSNGQSSEFYSISLNAGWEPDVWGRLRDLEDATIADYEATLADFRSARLSLAINTAQSWCNLVTAESQLTLAKETLASFRQNYQIIQRGYKLGTLRPLDDAFGRSNVAAAEGDLKARQLDRDEAARTLQILLGTYPDAFITASTQLPRIPPVRAGLPSELLARRPDLTASRARIYASAKRADASRKNLLPSFGLTANSGTSSPELSRLLDPSNLASTLAANIAQNLYSGGRLTAQARQSLADNENQIRLYEGDVLQAFREVESALATEQSLRKQEQFLLTDVENTALAERWAESDFVEGLDVGTGPSILEVLEAQRRALNAKAGLIALKNSRLQNHLDLLLALGGSI